MQAELFRDREDAGCKLADLLLEYEGRDVVVLAIPRGGVPVGYKIAERLHAQFDLIIPKKLPIPWNPEAGFGAITGDGTIVLNEAMVHNLCMTEDEIEQATADVRKEIGRRTEAYKDEMSPPELSGRNVILVDDGLASGYTMLAATESVRKHDPASVIVAVPVASSGASRVVSHYLDKLVAIIISERLPFAVADFYLQWRDVTDEDVRCYMNRAHTQQRAA